jgi:hypothetical protein
MPLDNRGPSKEQLPVWERRQPGNAEQFLAVARPRSGITTLIRVRPATQNLPEALTPTPCSCSIGLCRVARLLAVGSRAEGGKRKIGI